MKNSVHKQIDDLQAGQDKIHIYYPTVRTIPSTASHITVPQFYCK